MSVHRQINLSAGSIWNHIVMMTASLITIQYQLNGPFVRNSHANHLNTHTLTRTRARVRPHKTLEARIFNMHSTKIMNKKTYQIEWKTLSLIFHRIIIVSFTYQLRFYMHSTFTSKSLRIDRRNAQTYTHTCFHILA